MLDYDDYQCLLSELDSTVECAEAHGILCGILSLDSNSHSSDWLGLEDKPLCQLFAQFLAESQSASHADSRQGAAVAKLAVLHRETRAQLNDMNYDFSPLLPQDSETIALRTQALSLWCQGFLFGLSVSGLKTLDALSEASREIVEDFNAIVQLEEPCEEGDDEESAYMELVEYLRVGTFTLVNEHSLPAKSETLH